MPRGPFLYQGGTRELLESKSAIVMEENQELSFMTGYFFSFARESEKLVLPNWLSTDYCFQLQLTKALDVDSKNGIRFKTGLSFSEILE